MTALSSWQALDYTSTGRDSVVIPPVDAGLCNPAFIGSNSSQGGQLYEYSVDPDVLSGLASSPRPLQSRTETLSQSAKTSSKELLSKRSGAKQDYLPLLLQKVTKCILCSRSLGRLGTVKG